MDNKITALLVTVNAYGTVNPTLGIAKMLKNRGHQAVIVAEESMAADIRKLGFDVQTYRVCEEDDTGSEEAHIDWPVLIAESAKVLSKSPIEQLDWLEQLVENELKSIKYIDSRVAEIIKNVKPDVIIQIEFDDFTAVLNSGIPIVMVSAAAPLTRILDDRLPPPFLGLSLNDISSWKEGRKSSEGYRSRVWKKFNDFVVEKGFPEIPKYRFSHESKHLNVLHYPEPMADGYLKLWPLPDNYMFLDHSIRDSNEEFEIPKKLEGLLGKLIYFSMGTVSSSIVPLMKRLIAILAKSKHRFIVSTGGSHDQLQLPDNVWGQPYVPQLKVLPLVDLVITHGGNNSFVETLYFGKPMIVLPAFYDQHDNAQRAVEENIGMKFHPFHVTESELLNAIEQLLSDDKLNERVKQISRQMKSSESMNKFVDRLEVIAKTATPPFICY